MPKSLKHPARLVPIAFLIAIAVGTGLLMLPFARAEAGGAPFITALFTATSAICVTGLIVQDTATCWSAFGHVVILALIQIGGFGIMSGATLLSMLVTRTCPCAMPCSRPFPPSRRWGFRPVSRRNCRPPARRSSSR